MDKINEAFAEISKEDNECLKFAFDNLVPQYVKLSDGKFIGVHCEDDPGLIVELKAGYWLYGRLK